jgi:hypothetical protein
VNGVITRRKSDMDFDVAGRSVRLACDVYTCEDLAEYLRENTEVRFRGPMRTGGVPLGDFLVTTPSSTSLSSRVDAVDPASGALAVHGFTVLPSVMTAWGAPGPGGFQVGDTIEASGTYGGVPGLLLASSIRRTMASDPEIRGGAFARDEPDIVMLGRPIRTDAATLVYACGAASTTDTLFSMYLYSIDELRVELAAPASGPLRAVRVTINGDC